MAEMTTRPLAWRRTTFGTGAIGYTATDHHFGYAVTRRHSAWSLQVRQLADVAGLKTPVGQPVVDYLTEDTAKLCKAIAAEYSAFGADFSAADHGGKNRMTAAASIIYAREREGTF
jgi:hypothetical protein